MFVRGLVGLARGTFVAGLALSWFVLLASCELERESAREPLRGDGGGAGAASSAQALLPGCNSYTYGGHDYVFCADLRTWDSAPPSARTPPWSS